MTGLITVVMGPVLLCPDVRHGLCDKSVFLWRVDQRIVSFLQIGHLKPAFFVHYLQKRHNRHDYRRWVKRVKKQKRGIWGICDKSVSGVACKSGAISLAAFSAAAWVHGCMRGC